MGRWAVSVLRGKGSFRDGERVVEGDDGLGLIEIVECVLLTWVVLRTSVCRY